MCTSTQPHDGDIVRVTAKAANVPLHPCKERLLVPQAKVEGSAVFVAVAVMAVLGSFLPAKEAQRTHAVVEAQADKIDIRISDEAGHVALDAHAVVEAAAVDVDDDRQGPCRDAFLLVRCLIRQGRSVHVHVEAVLALGDERVWCRAGTPLPELRGRNDATVEVARAALVDGQGRRCTEAVGSRSGLCVRDAKEDIERLWQCRLLWYRQRPSRGRWRR